ncbi:hypothetical protein F4778DRAFT_484015 [Xylariomycetidae sp. FL2044]|nr:hypothetical protein F4778DRAFT_484015 [Xylariomycetidae sp. FL2044]
METCSRIRTSLTIAYIGQKVPCVARYVCPFAIRERQLWSGSSIEKECGALQHGRFLSTEWGTIMIRCSSSVGFLYRRCGCVPREESGRNIITNEGISKAYQGPIPRYVVIVRLSGEGTPIRGITCSVNTRQRNYVQYTTSGCRLAMASMDTYGSIQSEQVHACGSNARGFALGEDSRWAKRFVPDLGCSNVAPLNFLLRREVHASALDLSYQEEQVSIYLH